MGSQLSETLHQSETILQQSHKVVAQAVEVQQKVPHPHLRHADFHLDIKGPEWVWDCLYIYGRYRLHLHTHRNVNPYYSHGRAEIWHPHNLSWNHVYTLPWSSLSVSKLEVSFTVQLPPDDLAESLKADGRLLLEKTVLILGPPA